MLKKLMLSTAITALAIGGAFAQTSTSPDTSKPSGSATEMNKSPDMKGSTSAPSSTSKPDDSASKPSSTNTASTAAPSGQAKFISSQSADQMLTSNFIGMDVMGPDDKKIGDVNDVLFTKDHQVVAYVVGVGGFLGIGAKNVALAPDAFQVVAGKDAGDQTLKLNMTKDQLTQAQAFETQEEKAAAAKRSTTTGAGGGASRPAGSPPSSTK